MEITDEVRAAVAELTGEPLSVEYAQHVLAKYKDVSLDELKTKFSILFAGFEHSSMRDTAIEETLREMDRAILLREALHD